MNETIYNGGGDTSQLKPIESKGGIDLDQFEGQKKQIDVIEMIDVPDYNDPSKNSKALKIKTEKVTEVEGQEGTTPIFASELFSLKQDADGNWGWSNHEKAKLNRFMKKMGVDNPNTLVGKEVTLRVRTKDNQDGSQSQFLGFIHD